MRGLVVLAVLCTVAVSAACAYDSSKIEGHEVEALNEPTRVGLLGGKEHVKSPEQYIATVEPVLVANKDKIVSKVNSVAVTKDMLKIDSFVTLTSQVVSGIKYDGKALLKGGKYVVVFSMVSAPWRGPDELLEAQLEAYEQIVGGYSAVPESKYGEYLSVIEDALKSQKGAIVSAVNGLEVNDEVLKVKGFVELSSQVVAGTNFKGIARLERVGNRDPLVVKFTVYVPLPVTGEKPQLQDGVLYDPGSKCGTCPSNELIPKSPMCNGKRQDGCQCCVEKGLPADFPYALLHNGKYHGFYTQEECQNAMKRGTFAPTSEEHTTQDDERPGCYSGHFRIAEEKVKTILIS
eukprot:Nk52_evm12s252 gene=Nk52_evmTU12s252